MSHSYLIYQNLSTLLFMHPELLAINKTRQVGIRTFLFITCLEAWTVSQRMHFLFLSMLWNSAHYCENNDRKYEKQIISQHQHPPSPKHASDPRLPDRFAVVQSVGTPTFFPQDYCYYTCFLIHMFTSFVRIETIKKKQRKRDKFDIISHKPPKMGRAKLLAPFKNLGHDTC